MKKSLFLAVASVAVAAVSAKAQNTILYSTTFSTPTYVDGALAPVTTATDTTTPGQDGWLSSSAGLTNPIAVSNTATNGIVTLNNTGQDARRLFNSGATVNSGSVFLQVDINVSAAQATGDYFLHFSDGGVSNFYARTYIKSATGGFQLALTTSSGGTPVYGATLNLNQTYTLLVRYDFVTGATNDTGALFINPTTSGGVGDTAYVTAVTTGTDATAIGAVAFRQGSATAAPTLTIDNLQAFAVPEPSTYACVALGILGTFVVLRARRRTA